MKTPLEYLTAMSRWADSVELRSGRQGWTLICLVNGKFQSLTHPDLDELFAHFIDHTVIEGNWPVGFYSELALWRHMPGKSNS